MSEQSPEELDQPVEATDETKNPYDEMPVQDGVGFHDPEATVLDDLDPEVSE